MTSGQQKLGYSTVRIRIVLSTARGASQGAFINQLHSWRHGAVLQAIAIAGQQWQGMNTAQRQDWCLTWCRHQEQADQANPPDAGMAPTHPVWQAWAQDRQHIEGSSHG